MCSTEGLPAEEETTAAAEEHRHASKVNGLPVADEIAHSFRENAPQITFSVQEKTLLEKIAAYARSCTPLVVPRLAGGFVRDKLLNVPSSDIDIAVDVVSGLHFAEGLAAHLAQNQEFTEATHTFSDGTPATTPQPASQTRAHRIQSNPEKSKHIETAVLHVEPFSIDFAQLRCETYADTRIPVTTAGTPTEDAFRRDITINTLFYNLITSEIEDFTGRGLTDLASRRLDTPLDPAVTLLEDPLRVLRIFRFKARLSHFTVADRVYRAVALESVQRAFSAKVSCERVAIELMKMAGYPRGAEGIREIIVNRCVGAVLKLDGVLYCANGRPLSDSGQEGVCTPDILENPVVVIDISVHFFSIALYILVLFGKLPAELYRRCTGYEVACLSDEARGCAPALIAWLGSRQLQSQRVLLKQTDLGRTNTASGNPNECSTSTSIVPELNLRILRLYMLLHNFSGVLRLDGKRNAPLNVLIMRDSLKLSKSEVAAVRSIENGLELLRTTLRAGTVPTTRECVVFILACPSVWCECLVIYAVKHDCPLAAQTCEIILADNLAERVKAQPCVTGNDLKGRCAPKETARILQACFVNQILDPTLSKRDLIAAACAPTPEPDSRDMNR